MSEDEDFEIISTMDLVETCYAVTQELVLLVDNGISSNAEVVLDKLNEPPIEQTVGSIMDNSINKGRRRQNKTKQRKKMPNYNIQNCECRKNCIDKFRGNDIMKVRKRLTNHPQDEHLSAGIKILPIKQRRPRNRINQERSHSTRFTIIHPRTLNTLNVCKKAFMQLHNVGRKVIDNLIKHKAVFGSPRKEKTQGKHKNRPHKIPTQMKDQVRHHIRSFAAKDSHYRRKNSPNKIYIDERLTIATMHKMYLKKFGDADREAFGKKLRYLSYYRIFHNEFNIGFQEPKTDKCQTCEKYDVAVKNAKAQGNLDEVMELLVEKAAHKETADTFYEMIREEFDEDFISVCFDYEKNISLPRINIQDTYYFRQLTLSIFNIHNLVNSDVQMITSYENEMPKNVNVVCHRLCNYFDANMKDTTKFIVLFSDACGGQNKSWLTIARMHAYLLKNRNLKKLTIVYPYRGHTFLPCDRDFALNEEKINKMPTIYTRQQVEDVIKDARSSTFNINKESQRDNHPFEVVKGERDGMKDLHPVAKQIMKTEKKDIENIKVKFQKIKFLVMTQGSLLIKFKYGYTGNYLKMNPYKLSITERDLVREVENAPEMFHSNKDVKLSDEKISDLRKLLKYVPNEHKEEYEGIIRNQKNAKLYGPQK